MSVTAELGREAITTVDKRGQMADVLALRVKAEAGKSFTLAGAEGKYELVPGVVLNGKAAVTVELSPQHNSATANSEGA